MMYQDFSPQIACNLLANDKAQLVDVRSESEFASGALPNAINLPLSSIMAADNFLNKNKAVILYCVTGTRSSMAQQYLLQMGYHQVFDLGSYQNYCC